MLSEENNFNYHAMTCGSVFFWKTHTHTLPHTHSPIPIFDTYEICEVIVVQHYQQQRTQQMHFHTGLQTDLIKPTLPVWNKKKSVSIGRRLDLHTNMKV